MKFSAPYFLLQYTFSLDASQVFSLTDTTKTAQHLYTNILELIIKLEIYNDEDCLLLLIWDKIPVINQRTQDIFIQKTNIALLSLSAHLKCTHNWVVGRNTYVNTELLYSLLYSDNNED